MAAIDTQKLLEHLRAKWLNRPCPICQGGPWSVSDKTFQLLEFNQAGLTLGGPVVPVVPVICTNCGNTVLINALIVGLVPLVVEAVGSASGTSTAAAVGSTAPSNTKETK